MLIMQLTENVALLGNRHFNFFVVGQKEAAVVECGVTGGVYSFKQQWAELGTKPEITYLVASHAHFDHVCGIPALHELFPQAEVVASSEAQRILNRAKVIRNFFEQDDKMSAVLTAEGIIPEIPLTPAPATIGVDRIVAEGERINLTGGVALSALYAPGHSPCNLAFYMPQDEVMFISDAGGFQISDDSIFPIFFQGYDLYIETLKRLKGFPTRVLAIPHERIWAGDEVGAFYDRALETARTAFVSIESMLDSGCSEEDMKLILYSRYYRGNLRIYTPENIKICVELLIRRVKECL
jgi:2-aminobenzoylacetyl-CoA thioesterase